MHIESDLTSTKHIESDLTSIDEAKTPLASRPIEEGSTSVSKTGPIKSTSNPAVAHHLLRKQVHSIDLHAKVDLPRWKASLPESAQVNDPVG